MKHPLARVRVSDSALLVIDLQEKLMPAIHEGAGVIGQARKFIVAAHRLGMPILATEQYPKGIGPTCAVIREALGASPIIEKMTFSSCGADSFWRTWKEFNRPNTILCGVEAHVCVQQTALDLLERGQHVFVLADAVGSRRPSDREPALARLHDAGAIVTTMEAVIFELLGRAGTPEFKEILKLLK